MAVNSKKTNGSTNGNGNGIGLSSSKNGSIDFFSDVSYVVTRTLSDPAFMLAAVISGIIILTHLDDVYAGPLGHFLREHEGHSYVKWVTDNIDKVFGLLVLAPTAFRAKPAYRNFVIAGLSAAVIALPPLLLKYYLCISAVIHLYLHSRSPTTKTMLIAIAIGSLYVLGFRPSMLAAPGSVPDPSAARSEAPLPQYSGN